MLASLGAYPCATSTGTYPAGMAYPGAQSVAAQPALPQQLLAQLAQQHMAFSQHSGLAAAQLPNSVAGMGGAVQHPQIYGAPPMLYYYPSPPISPQNYYSQNSMAMGQQTG